MKNFLLIVEQQFRIKRSKRYKEKKILFITADIFYIHILTKT